MGQDISTCRICGSLNLKSYLFLGELALTGFFPSPGEVIPFEPLDLSQCEDCKLVQLRNRIAPERMYGVNYGYESHLNSSMVKHLQQTAFNLEEKYLSSGKNFTCMDIASNDGTLLSGFRSPSIQKIGVDPLIDIFSDNYPPKAIKVNAFFDENIFNSIEIESIDLVTSLSVLYDLDDPISFAGTIWKSLKWGGIWHFEQSYLLTMLDKISYDTICHEHLLYLSAKDINTILKATGFKVLEVELNDINGGSIAITAIKTREVENSSESEKLTELISAEIDAGLEDGTALVTFAENVKNHREQVAELLSKFLSKEMPIFALGASTKGNVFLQYTNLDNSVILGIGEVNAKKFGKVTPGSAIPIVDEKDIFQLMRKKPSLLIVLPWHFRENLLTKIKSENISNAMVFFPFPKPEIISI